MRLVTYEIERKVKLGVVSQDEKWIYPLQSLGMDYTTMQEVIEHISDSELQLLEHASGLENSRIEGAAPWSEVKVLAPIPNPIQDVICLGINYMAHAEESARFKKEAFGGERPYAIYFPNGWTGRWPRGKGFPAIAISSPTWIMRRSWRSSSARRRKMWRRNR